MQETKTDLIIQLLAAGLNRGQLMARAGCSQAMVYKVMRGKGPEIEALRNDLPQNEKEQRPCGKLPQGQSLPRAIPKASPVEAKRSVPVLDMAKSVPAQLEQFAWSIIADAAAGGDISTKQANAAREIIKQAAKERIPAPVDRRMIFKVDVIDVDGDKFVPVSQVAYEVKH